MSFLALAEIRHVEPPSSSALLLLFILAEYAGADGICYPSQATLAERSRLKERAVRDNLHLLAEAGLIRVQRRARKNGSRTSDAITLTYYTPEQAVEAGDRIARQPAKSAGRKNAVNDDGDTENDQNDNRRNSPVANRRLKPDLPADSAGPTTFEPVREPITQDAGAGARSAGDGIEEGSPDLDRFEAVLTAWISTGETNSRTDRDQSRAAWIEAVKSTPSERLAEAAMRALADDKDFKRRGPPGLQRWLSGRRFEAWLVAVSAAPKVAPIGRFPDAAIRAAVADRLGEDFVRSYLDPSGWDADHGVILTRTSFAADKLRSHHAMAALASAGVTSISVKPAMEGAR